MSLVTKSCFLFQIPVRTLCLGLSLFSLSPVALISSVTNSFTEHKEFTVKAYDVN